MDATQFVQNYNLLEGLPTLAEVQQKFQPNSNTAQNFQYPDVPFVNAAITQPVEINQALTMPKEKETPQTNADFKLFKDYYPRYPTMTPREYEARSNIMGLKTSWKAHQELIDELGKYLPQASDEDRKLIQGKIDLLKAQQKDYSDAANVIRTTAGAMGWNMTGMGADDSFEKSTQLLALDQARGTSALLDMPSTTAQKRNVYEQMLERGVAPHMARAVAESYHDEFRENNMNKLMEGIKVYGTNGDGSLNEFGQMLIGKLAYESPHMAENIVNGFASPRELFGINANLQNTRLIQDAQDRRNELNNQNARAIADANNRFKQWQTETTEAAKDRRIEFEEAGRNNRKAADIQVELEKIYTKTPKAQFGQFLELGMELYGGDKTKAVNFAMEHIGNGGKGKKSKPSKGTFNTYSSILNDIYLGNDESAREKYNSLDAKKSEDPVKFFGDWDDEEVGIESELERAIYEFLTTQYEYTNDEDLQAQRNKAIQKLNDRISLIGSDFNISDLEGARKFARHHEKDKKGENPNDTSADQKIRNILDAGKNNNNDGGTLPDYFGGSSYTYGVKPVNNGGYRYGTNS